MNDDLISRQVLQEWIKDKTFGDIVVASEHNFDCLPPVTLQPCGDAISRQAVLNIVRGCNNAIEEPRIFDCHNAGVKFEQYITELPSVNPQEPKWIPVSDRLPKLREDEDDTFISDNVLVWLSHEFDAENPMICYYFKYDEWEGFVPTALSKDWQDIHSGLVYPVAWMPLPEPYEAGGEVSDADSN